MKKVDPEFKKDAQKQINDLLAKTSNEYILHLFDEANKNDTSISRLHEIVDEISGFFGILLLPIGQEHFYRARYWGNELNYPKCFSQILEPKPEFTEQNRCNIKHKPTLYVSTHPAALVSECHYKEGDIYAMAQFDRELKTEDLSCLMLGLDPQHSFEGNPAMANMANFHIEFFGKNHSKYNFIEQQVHKQFVRDNDKNGLTYRFTAHLCEKYFSSCPDLDAIAYPSIANQGSVNNLAIRTNTFSKTYVGKKVGIFEVLRDGSSRQLAGSLVNPDGSLDWSHMLLLDQPKAVGVRKIDPNDPRIYIAPWKQAI